MKRPPSDSLQRPLLIASASAVSGGFRTLGILSLGEILGILATNWLTPEADSASPVNVANFLGLAGSSQGGETQSESRTDLSARRAESGDVSGATVCVKTPKGWGEQACASGVSIDPALVGIDPAQGAVVLTNYHVVADTNRPPLQLNGRGEMFTGQIIRSSPEFDLAVLLVPGAKFPIATLAQVSPAQGTAVRAIGFPNDQPLTVKNSSLLGTTQNCLAVAPCLTLQQGTITFGNSGGPLEANGQVIGITQGEIEDELAIPVEQIRQFLAGQTPTNSRTPRPESYSEGYSGYPGGYPDGYPGGYPEGDYGEPPFNPVYPPMRQMPYPPYPPYPMEAPPPYPAW